MPIKLSNNPHRVPYIRNSHTFQIYEKSYTFRRMNIQVVAITCSAALMLIIAKALHQSPHDDEETVANLKISFRTLEGFDPARESAQHAQSFLFHMQELWDI